MESASFASKKRKIRNDGEDEDDEEEMMEKFYALIKTIREARDRFIINDKKRKLEEGKHVAVWKPSFQRQDFMEDDDQLKKPTMSFATQTREATDNGLKEEVKEGLDLTLSL